MGLPVGDGAAGPSRTNQLASRKLCLADARFIPPESGTNNVWKEQAVVRQRFTAPSFGFFLGMEKINFSGGEPFLQDRGEFVGKLVQFCKQELKLPSVSIVSNGSLIRERWFKKYGKEKTVRSSTGGGFGQPHQKGFDASGTWFISGSFTVNADQM